MGIKNLTQLIKKKSPESIQHMNLYSFKDKRIAIDTSIFIYRSLINVRHNNEYLRNKNGKIISHIQGLYYKTIQYLSLGITPIYIFDGKPPIEKSQCIRERSQKAKESKKKQVKISVKEIQLKPKIDTNDFKIKLNKSRKFLDSGDKVKFTMRFRGREAEHPEFGQKVLDNYVEELSDIAMIESTSSPDGKSLTMVLAPFGGKK